MNNFDYVSYTKLFCALHKKVVDLRKLIPIIDSMMHCNKTHRFV